MVFLLFFYLEVLCVIYFLYNFEFCVVFLSLSLAMSGWPQIIM